MPNIKVKKDQPIPVRALPSKYPFGSLDVGQSFDLPSWGSLTSVRTRASKLNAAGAKRFTVRKKLDGTYGVWRTA